MSIPAPSSVEQLLRESEERYRNTFEFAPVGIVIVDPSRRFVRANRRFCEIVGYSVNEILALTLPQISHPDDVAVMERHIRRLERGQSDVETYQRRYIRKDGGVVWTEVTVAAARDASGATIQFTGIVEDITERRRTEGQLALQSRLLDSVQQAVIAMTPDGQITFWNRFAEELYGWSVAEALGRSALELVPDPESAELAAEVLGVLSSGHSWTGEIVVRTRTGRAFTALATDSPIFDADGNVVGVISVSQDISEIRFSRLLQSALARLGALAVAHTGLDFLFARTTEETRQLLGVDVVEIQKDVDGHLVVAGRAAEVETSISCSGLAEQALAGADSVLIESRTGVRQAVEGDGDSGEIKGISVVIESGDQQRWGVISAYAAEHVRLEAPEVDFLRTVATVLGQTIDRRRVEVELRVRAAQQSAIAELGRITATGVTQRVLERACALVMEGLGVEHAALYEPSPDGRTLLAVAGDRSLDALPADRSHAGIVYRTGTTSVVTEAGVEPHTLLPENATAAIATPVGIAERRFSVLSAWTLAERTFRKVDVEFLESVAAVIAEARQRQVAQAELTESESRYRSVVEGASEIIFSIGPAGEFLSLNPAFETITGWRADDWIGRPFTELIVEEERAPKLALLRSMLREPRSVRTQVRIRAVSGAVLLDVASSPRIMNGRVVEIVGFARDVTEERRLEGKLEQATRLTSLGRLAATVAHEFNNVLMGILPFAEILRREAEASPQTLTAVEQIARSVQRGKRITEDILRFAQPAEPVVSSLDVNAWLRDLAPEARSLAGPKYTVKVDVDDDGLFIAADHHQLHQAIINLVLNARDAMPQGGVIRIAARRESPDAIFPFGDLPKPERYAHLFVEDRGNGIGPETLVHIFEPLFTTKKTGTGLGLPVTRQVVSRHGGEIFVETAVGVGTKFHLFIPLAAEGVAVVADHHGTATRRFRRILLVEDEQAVSAGLVALLSLEGIETEVVESGAAVLPALARSRPDAVVLDIGLPDMDGTAVFSALSQLYPDLPVVFSSGHGDASMLEKDLASPHVEFLLKPYDINVLLQTLDRVVG